MINKKLLSSILAGLVAFNSHVIPLTKVKAGSTPQANGEISNESSFTPLKFRSMFNMTEEESKKIINSLSIDYTTLSIYGELFILPVIAKTKQIIDDTNKQISINERNEVLRSEFEKFIPSNISKNRFKSGYTDQIRELVSNEIIGYGDDGGNVILNNDFFKNEIISKPFGEITCGFPGSEPKSSLVSKEKINSLTDRITLGEYFEFYKKEIPDMYWAVRYNAKKNTNSTIPKLQDGILDRDLFFTSTFLYAFFDKNKKCVKVSLSDNFVNDYYPDDSCDIFTKENIVEGSKLSKKYLENNGINTDIVDYEVYSPELFSIRTDYVDFNPELKKLMHKFIQCKTVRDVIEAYQYFPIELQIDYSYFDFSKNNNISRGWRIVANEDKLTGGESMQLRAETDAGQPAEIAQWVSSDPKVATVSADGLLTAAYIAQGGEQRVTITARHRDSALMEDTLEISVRPAPLTKSIALYADGKMTGKEGFEIDLGSEPALQLTASTYPADARPGVTWKSSASKVASVDESGLVMGLKKGAATITVTAQDGSKAKASVKVSVTYLAKEIDITGKTDTLKSGGQATLKAEVLPAEAVNKKVFWVSSDESIATVSGSGAVKAKKVTEEKMVTITATAQDGSGVTAEFVITVTP